MKLQARKTKKMEVIEISPEKILLTKDEYTTLENMFIESQGWDRKNKFGVHLDYITLEGGYKTAPQKPVRLRVEVEKAK